MSAVLVPGCGKPEWPQFGGPNRDFTVHSVKLADSWPEDGPKALWKRELGDGYSTIVADGGLLYTMYRTDDNEFTVALRKETGETVWEHKNPSPFTPVMAQFGPGPHTTPLVAGNRLYTIGTNAVLHCYNKKTGEVIWKHDLAGEFGAPIPERGYGSSPIAYKNTIIVAVDRKRPADQEGAAGAAGGSEDKGDEAKETDQPAEGQSLIAFDQATGRIAWKSQDYPIGYASPILIDFDGEEQLVLVMQDGIMAVDPNGGGILWHTETTPQGANIMSPVWNGGNLVFFSSAYDSGARAIKIGKVGGKTEAEQIWYTRKMRMHHGNAVRIGDYVYGSSGDFGPAFFMGLNINTGEVAWRERGFAKATCLYADGKVIILDENGQLALTTASPEGLTVHSKCKIAEPTAWAAPTLVGRTLYVRDRKHIMALDVG